MNTKQKYDDDQIFERINLYFEVLYPYIILYMFLYM